MHNKKIVIVNRVRFTMFLSVITLVLALLLNNVLGIVFASDTYKDYNKVFVQKGDSIWNIAKENNPNGEDIRKIVYEIREVNDIENEWIKPGDILKIPRD
ncbi:MAG: LysM peptidoglycan-binding domain-containing protein [Senegalia sp. (in: firmicutes)]|uniref:LysM peptidoglycan-binding domain-containing protein n=1 Tax=Senegalia sp. (in: firmicutes) TaxID=1924098 RepID=UPI003F94A139